MKRLMLTVMLCVMVLSFSGCPFDTSAQRIEALEEAIATSQTVLEKADEDIAALQLVIEKSKIYLEDSDLDEELTAKVLGLLSKAQVEMEKALAKKTEVQISLARWQDQITEIKTGGEGLGEELLVYGEGLKHIGGYVPAPIGAYLGLGGTVVALIGSILVSLKKAKADKSIKTGLVGSVDELLKTLGEVEAAKARIVLKANQLPPVRNAVREIHSGTTLG